MDIAFLIALIGVANNAGRQAFTANVGSEWVMQLGVTKLTVAYSPQWPNRGA